MESMEKITDGPKNKEEENTSYAHLEVPKSTTVPDSARLERIRSELKDSTLIPETDLSGRTQDTPPRRPIIANPQITGGGFGKWLKKAAAYAGIFGTAAAGNVDKAEAAEPPSVSGAHTIKVAAEAQKSSTNVFVYEQKQWPKKEASAQKPATMPTQAPLSIEINLSNITEAGKFAVTRMEKARADLNHLQNKDDANAYLKDHYEGFVGDFYGPNGHKDLHWRFVDATDDDLNAIAASATELRNTVSSLETKFGIKGGKKMRDKLTNVETIAKRFTTYAGKTERRLLKERKVPRPTPTGGSPAEAPVSEPGYGGAGSVPGYGGSGELGAGGFRYEQGTHQGGGSFGSAPSSSGGSVGGGGEPRY